MRKESQDKVTREKKAKQVIGWDKAIAEAESQISQHEVRITKLRLSIDIFRDMKARGEPFTLGESSPKSTVAA